MPYPAYGEFVGQISGSVIGQHGHDITVSYNSLSSSLTSPS